MAVFYINKLIRLSSINKKHQKLTHRALHFSICIIFLASSGQHPISAQPELHPAPALQGSHFQRGITQRNLSPHPGTSGSAAAPNLANGG